MFSSLITKTLYDKRWFVLGWGIGSIALFALTAAFYPLVADTIDDLLKSIPPSLTSIMGEAGAYSTYPGYLASAVFGIRAEMLFAPMAIILALSLSLNEELSGRMYQLLAQPISRRSIALQKWVAGIICVGVIILVTILALITTSAAIGESVPYELLAEIGVMSFLFTAAIFSLTFGLAIAFGRRSIAIILPVVWVMGSLLLDSLSAQVSVLREIDWLSILRYYDTGSLVANTIRLQDVAVLVAISGVGVLLAVTLFDLRDIRETE